MKMKNVKRILSAVCIFSVIASIGYATTAYAATKTIKQLYAEYSGIQIMLDGQMIEPKDINGVAVDPFIVDGTTYLPVRAVADALGLNVEWDQNAQMVVLSTKPQTSFDLSLGENIGEKSYDEMLALLGISDTDAVYVQGSLWTGEVVEYEGREFKQHIDFSVRAMKGWQNAADKERVPYMGAVGYIYDFPEGALEDELLAFVKGLYTDMVEVYGNETHPSYDNVISDAIASNKLPSGRTIWIDPENEENVIAMQAFYQNQSVYRVAVYRGLGRG